jgi:hypothetical protein
MILFSLFVSATYNDYAINDITIPGAISGDEEFSIIFNVANNSSTTEDINVLIKLFNPQGEEIFTEYKLISVTANESMDITKTIKPIIDVNLIASTQPYAVRARINNEVSGNISNNVFTKYFTVIKSSKKIPVPDMPVYFGFIIALFVAFAFSGNIRKKNKK